MHLSPGTQNVWVPGRQAASRHSSPSKGTGGCHIRTVALCVAPSVSIYDEALLVFFETSRVCCAQACVFTLWRVVGCGKKCFRWRCRISASHSPQTLRLWAAWWKRKSKQEQVKQPLPQKRPIFLGLSLQGNIFHPCNVIMPSDWISRQVTHSLYIYILSTSRVTEFLDNNFQAVLQLSLTSCHFSHLDVFLSVLPH